MELLAGHPKATTYMMLYEPNSQILKLAYYQNDCMKSNQLSHSNKTTKCPSRVVQQPYNKFERTHAAILEKIEKIAISQQWSDRSP